jgi:hypothetical protein
VIIAVPVVLWTITAFVRAYIAPPQIPTFRPIAAATAPPAPQNVQSQNVQVAVQTVNITTATDARAPSLEIKKPSDPAAAATPAPQPAPLSAVLPPPFAAANPNTGASTGAAPATVAAPPGIAPASIAPANVAPQPALQAARATIAPAAPSAPAMPAWPAPTAFNPSSPPTDTIASLEQATVDNADNLPAGAPLHGKIPLPPHRPKVVASTNIKLASNAMPVAGLTPVSVPLPRARPASAPEPAPVETPYPAYDPAALH